MGQQLSRRLAGKFDKALESAKMQMETQMKAEVAAKKAKGGFTDPNAAIGFTRGTGPDDPRDLAQEAYHREIQKNNTNQEMPEDLIKFMNDVGPLKKSLDREFTSPRLRESLKPGLLEDPMEGDENSKRSIRDMPLIGDVEDYVTKRTTNFSRNETFQETFGLTEIQFYEMLARIKTDDELWAESHGNEKEKEEQMQLMQTARKYVELPIIMKDKRAEEGRYLGLDQETIDSMDRLESLTVQRAKGVKLVLSELLDRENTKNRNQISRVLKK